jgi:hypothetical protein
MSEETLAVHAASLLRRPPARNAELDRQRTAPRRVRHRSDRAAGSKRQLYYTEADIGGADEVWHFDRQPNAPVERSAK